METLLKNIGYILDNNPCDEIKAYARSLLRRIAEGEGDIYKFYFQLVARHVNYMDEGADWTAIDVIAETTKDFIFFDKKYLKKDFFMEKGKIDHTRPDFFEIKKMPLFESGSEFDD